MRLINISTERFPEAYAIVDDADYDNLKKWNWHCDPSMYARRSVYKGRGPQKSMHREIMRPPIGMEIDHINGNGLDNRRSNLRICTRAENTLNRCKRSDAVTSKFKGVDWHKKAHFFRTRIQVDKRNIHIGYFKSEIEAAKAYNDAALIYHGEFARLNEVCGL